MKKNALKSKAAESIFQLIVAIKANWQIFSDFREGEFVKTDEVVYHITSKIKYDKGIISIEHESEPTIQPEFRFVFPEKYFARLSRDFPIIQDCIVKIEDEFQRKHSEVPTLLSMLIKYILLNEDEKKLNQNRAVELTSIFIDDLRKVPPVWSIKLWVTSIWMENDEIHINKNFLIRRPVDLDYDYSINPYFSFLGDEYRGLCDSIIEIRRTSSSEKEIREDLRKLLRILRLFDLGSVQFVNIELTANSIVRRRGQVGFIDGRPSEKNKKFSYEMTVEKSKKFNAFYENLIDILANSSQIKEDANNTALSISIDRYMESITTQQSIEASITNVITSLEALLLRSDERSELSHKLSQRISRLMSIFEIAPVKVYSKMKRAYDIRSTYIHGAVLPSNERNDLVQLHKDVTQYARLCILIFISILVKSNKDGIIKKIDNALLDNNANNKLVNDIKSSKIFPCIVTPSTL